MNLRFVTAATLILGLSVSCSSTKKINGWLNKNAEFEVQKIFDDGRFPNIVVAKNGNVVATWGRDEIVSKISEDGGKTWKPEILIAESGIHSGGTTVDDQTGDIFVFLEEGHPPAPISIYVSKNNGDTWARHNAKITPDKNGNMPAMHMNEHGITLKSEKYAGRILRPSRYYGKTNERSEWPAHYTNAIYSDDHGNNWKTSDPFPANGTGEATLVELSDGTVYYNSRRHLSTDGLNPRRRHIAKSYDGGETWTNLSVSEELPDGDQYRDYGLMAGLTRIPIENHDILLFSNIISEKGRKNGHVWVSFDGGKTWPAKKLIDAGSFGYSSMIAGRNNTESEGLIYLFYESDDGGKIAKFNLQWFLDGKNLSDFLK
ncbi:sialidase family protein [Kriegella aquimaris]|uniref:exo-alpha-sialidase n=1 Tax=Kriegella aquimaris TaxID=192904 RepID=A0A1G9VCG8_9FLAO|nr:sialidase family protein [Kriegella aquimaris]SDM69914.1 BNR repeat-like domain-containing protein [Kriegella aquimaris]